MRAGRSGLARTLSWNLADQAVSSLGSAGSALLIARAVNATDFGVYGICFAAYTFLLGISRSTGSQVISVKFPLGSNELGKWQVRACAGMAIVTGLMAMPLLALGSLLLLQEQQRSALLLFAALLSGLLLQDTWRDRKSVV